MRAGIHTQRRWVAGAYVTAPAIWIPSCVCSGQTMIRLGLMTARSNFVPQPFHACFLRTSPGATCPRWTVALPARWAGRRAGQPPGYPAGPGRTAHLMGSRQAGASNFLEIGPKWRVRFPIQFPDPIFQTTRQGACPIFRTSFPGAGPIFPGVRPIFAGRVRFLSRGTSDFLRVGIPCRRRKIGRFFKVPRQVRFFGAGPIFLAY